MLKPFMAMTLAATAALLQPAAANSDAAAFPDRPIRMIVPVSPGGTLDVTTRQVMQNVANVLGQPVVVENKPGASLLVGTQFVAKALADGYTLLAMSNTFVTAPSLLKDAGYDPVRDFTGVSLMVQVPMTILVNAESPLHDLGQLIELARSGADKVTYGSAGTGSAPHIAAAMLFLQSGADALHVPFKGNAPVLSELMAGRLTISVNTITEALPHLRSGRLRALAVTGERRSAVLPDVPTVAESGVPGYAITAFNGIAVPAGSPPAVVERLHAAVAEAITPELRDKLLEGGAELQASASPQAFTDFIRDQVANYAQVIRKVNIRAE